MIKDFPDLLSFVDTVAAVLRSVDERKVDNPFVLVAALEALSLDVIDLVIRVQAYQKFVGEEVYDE